MAHVYKDGFSKHGDFSWLTVELPEGICCRLLFLGHCDVETSNDVRSQVTEDSNGCAP